MMKKQTCSTCAHGAFIDKNQAETLDARMKTPDNGECRIAPRKIFMAVLPGPDRQPMPQFFSVWPSVKPDSWCSEWKLREDISAH